MNVSCRLTVFGGIKTGSKKLFIRVETGAFCEIEPICVLDFYVNEDYQRQGLGKHLFEVTCSVKLLLADHVSCVLVRSPPANSPIAQYCAVRLNSIVCLVLK